MPTSPEHDIHTRKAALRERLKAARETLPESLRLAHSQAIAERLFALDAVRQAKRCFVFISSGPEVHTHDVVRRLMAAGKEVCVPKIVSKIGMIANRLRDWSGLRPAQLGILTPIETEPVEKPFDVVVTPGLGFTTAGQRLGFGAGYYDRWFASHASGLKVAVAFEVQIVEAMPTNANDIPVDMILTERRSIAIRPPAASPTRSSPP